MKPLLIIVSLICGIHYRGVVTNKIYEGMAYSNDLYIVNVCGIAFPIVSDDFSQGEIMEIYIENGEIQTKYIAE